MKLKIEGHEIELLFTCDPEKNTECKKTVCQVECFHTKEIQFAKNLAHPITYSQFCAKHQDNNTALPVIHERTAVGDYRCPKCNAAFFVTKPPQPHKIMPYCGNCGQHLYWNMSGEE